MTLFETAVDAALSRAWWRGVAFGAFSGAQLAAAEAWERGSVSLPIVVWLTGLAYGLVMLWTVLRQWRGGKKGT